MLHLDRLVLIASSLASAILAVAVYSRAPERVWHRLFAVHASGVALWIFLNYLLQVANTRAEADLWLRLTHPAVALVICTCLDLFWIFPEQTHAAALRSRIGLYTVGALVSLVGLAPNLYRSLEIASGTILVEYGWPFQVFGAFTALTLGYADYVLIRKMPRLTGLQRAQVKYVLTGMIMSQIVPLITMILLPLVWHNTYYSRWGSAAYIFMVAFVAYAIAKHGIVRPAVAATRAGAYALTAVAMVALAAVWLALVGPYVVEEEHRYILYVACGVLVGLGGVPLHLVIRRRLERALPGAHMARSAGETSEAILRTLDSQELPRSLTQVILEMLQATHVSVFLRDPSGAFRLAARRLAMTMHEPPVTPQAIAAGSNIVAMVRTSRTLLIRSQVRRFQSLEQAQVILPEMRDMDAEIIAPVLWEDNLTGLVVIGERLAGDMYGPDDLVTLRNLLPQISLALHNADLFDGVVRMKQYYENVVQQMQSGVIAVNADHTISMFNRAAEQMLGLRADEIIGAPLDVLPDPIAGRLSRALSGMPVRPEDRLEVEAADGEKIPVACSTSRWRGSPLAEEGAIAVISDLTLVEELQRERQQAEHLSVIRLLSAGMAHELRNPLVAIRTFAELLPTRWEDAEFRMDFLATAQDEIDRIDRLLDNMLMLSKPADAVVEATDVDRVCEGVIRAMSPVAEAKQIRLVADLRLGPDRPFYGDRSRLHQALMNLIKNAIEAEREGGTVCVSTQETHRPGVPPVLTITVHNASSHIPEDQIDLIFRPFYTRRAGGTGLGLPVCQTIIEEHHGTIRVTSRLGEGTSFIIDLPLESVAGETVYDRDLRYRHEPRMV
jgi:PAS domain S-box-containing protein